MDIHFTSDIDLDRKPCYGHFTPEFDFSPLHGFTLNKALRKSSPAPRATSCMRREITGSFLNAAYTGCMRSIPIQTVQIDRETAQINGSYGDF